MAHHDRDEIAVLDTVYLCPCGQPAIMTFGFPGEAIQGRCELHEQGTQLRKEIEPGRTHVAAVQRFDE
jgi:hypothetical protein